MKLVIDRGEWLSGEALVEVGGSALRHPGTGLMCCMGIYGQACGISPVAMENRGYLAELDDVDRSKVDERLFRWVEGDQLGNPENSSRAFRIAEANDGALHNVAATPKPRPSAAETEAKITELFAEIGVEVEFVGDSTVALQKALDYVGEKVA